MTTCLAWTTRTYAAQKRQKKKALKKRNPEKDYNYIIPRRKGSVKTLAGYTLSDGQLRRQPLEGDDRT